VQREWRQRRRASILPSLRRICSKIHRYIVALWSMLPAGVVARGFGVERCVCAAILLLPGPWSVTGTAAKAHARRTRTCCQLFVDRLRCKRGIAVKTCPWLRPPGCSCVSVCTETRRPQLARPHPCATSVNGLLAPPRLPGSRFCWACAFGSAQQGHAPENPPQKRALPCSVLPCSPPLMAVELCWWPCLDPGQPESTRTVSLETGGAWSDQIGRARTRWLPS